MRLNGFVLALKFELSDKRGQILVGNFVYMKLWQILKFHERVISALILVASFARPKISSQLLRVNGILKFALRYKFIQKGRQGDSSYGLLAVTRRGPSKNPRTFKVHASVLRTACVLLKF